MRWTLLALTIYTPLLLAKPIPIESFAKLAKYEDVVISPTGKYLAITTRHENGRHFVAILTTEDMKLASYVPQYGKTEPFAPHWISDERLAVSIAEIYGELDTPRANGEIFAMNADGSKKRLLSQHKAGIRSGGSSLSSKNDLNGYAWIINTLPKDPEHILLGYYPFGTKYEKKPQAYKVDIYTSKALRVAVAPSIWAEFVTDADGEITHTVGIDTDTNTLLVHKKNGSDWQLTDSINNLGSGSKPIASIAGSDTVIIEDMQENGPSKLYTLNLDNNQRKLIYKHSSVDYQKLILDDKTNSPIAVHFEPDLPDLHIIDSNHPIGHWYPALFQAFNGNRVEIISTTEDYKTLVIRVSGDNEPGQFYLFNTQNKKLQFILKAKPWLDSEKLAHTKPFEFKNRDGITLHGYLTTPNNAKGKLPLIVHPHGGPHGPRDYWQYDDDIQLLASRGYAVLQINFRGSGGYGNDFEKSGYRHWGDLIQNDIIDATKWAISERNIDPNRVCIYGASFGGYSSLMAPTLKPGLFKCSAGYAGIYDLNLMWNKGDIKNRNSGQTYLSNAIGKNVEDLNKFSPSLLAKDLKLPIFLAHGEEDERASVDHFYAMKEALEKTGNPARTLLIKGEGHGFYLEKNRQKLYENLLQFFDEYIGKKATAKKL